MLQLLEQASLEDDFEQIRQVLTQAVSGFVPQCDINDVLWKQAATNLR
jgi:hypothetical protein